MSSLLASIQPSSAKALIAGAATFAVCGALYGKSEVRSGVLEGRSTGLTLGAAMAVSEFGSDFVVNTLNQYLPLQAQSFVQNNGPMLGFIALSSAVVPELLSKPMKILELGAIGYAADYIADMIVPDMTPVSSVLGNGQSSVPLSLNGFL